MKVELLILNLNQKYFVNNKLLSVKGVGVTIKQIFETVLQKNGNDMQFQEAWKHYNIEVLIMNLDFMIFK